MPIVDVKAHQDGSVDLVFSAKPRPTPSNGPAYPDGYLPDYLYSEAGVGHIPTRYIGKPSVWARIAGWLGRALWPAFFFALGAGAMAWAVIAKLRGWI